MDETPVQPTAQTAPEGSRGVRYAFTRGDQLVFDTPATRSAQSLDAAILRAFGGQANLDPITLSRAVAVSATAFACIERRANTIAQLPLYPVFQDDRIDPIGSPFQFFIKQSPRLLERSSRSADIWGYIYLRKRRNPNGFPTGLEWLNPVNVQEVGQPAVQYYQVFNESTWMYERVEVEDMVLAANFDSKQNGTGISRVEAAYRLIGLDFGTVTHALAFMTNSARIDGMLTFDSEVSPDQMTMAQQQWQQFKGAANGHKTAVMPTGARWTPVQATPKDLMMSETKKDVRAEVAVIFDVDLGLLGLEGVADALSANSTYSAKEVAFIRNAALPFARTVFLPAINEQWAGVDFKAAYEIRVDEAKIPALAESNLVKADTANGVRSSGLYTHNEARALVGMDAEEDYLKRAPDEPLKLWQGGAITLNLLHHYTLGRAPLVDSGLAEQGEVMLLNGVIIPVTRIAELANANVDRMKNPIPFSPFGSTPTPPQDVTVTTPEAPALSDGQRDTGDNLFVGLDLANNVDLVGLQRQLRERYPNVTWNDPADFHITVLYAPVCDPAKARAFADALNFIDVPELTLRIGSLKSFDSIGEHAIHFRVRENADLRDFQETVYQLALDCGVETSSYTLPGMWTPHITMGYAPEKTTVYWSSKLAVAPKGLVCNHGDKPLISGTPLLPAPDTITRATSSLDLAISFADHAFVKAARRELSAYLAERGYKNPTWQPEGAWRLDLLSFDQWSANLVSRFIREVDYSATRPLDLETAGFAEQGGRLYLVVTPNEGLDALTTSLALDMEATGMTPVLPMVTGILLCELANGEAVDLTGIPAAIYPLIGTNITAYKNGVEAAYQWALRSLSRGQELDLERWEKVARRKGKDAPFTTRSISPLAYAFIALSLEDDEPDLEAVFEAARGMLTETRRSFSDTRAGFVAEMIKIIGAAQRDETSRAKFAGSMRSAIRRFGLMAFRDGLESTGWESESFSKTELAAFRQLQETASGYVSSFGTEIFKAGGISAGEVELRAQFWANKTLTEFYLKGQLLGAPERKYRWEYGDTDHCETCQALNGQVRTMAEWTATYLPQSSDLACHGFNCQCRLVPVED